MHIATAALIGVLVGIGAFLLDNAMRPPQQTCPAVQQQPSPSFAPNRYIYLMRPFMTRRGFRRWRARLKATARRMEAA